LSKTPGEDSNGLQTNMVINSSGLVGIPSNDDQAQVEIAVPGSSTRSGVEATGGNPSAENANGGTGGVFTGGNSTNASGNGNGGDGGIFAGGRSDSSGVAGDGILALQTGPASDVMGYAGFFEGDVHVAGLLTAASKDFEIDDPLDPANKYLVHASVESSEMMNIYSGNVTTDELGLATVKLPGWFEAENTDFRYQLTVIGQFAQAIIKDKIANGQFRIMTNASHVEVSWQVTAVRQDAYAKAHPLVAERVKPAHERGYYIHPELYGQPAEKGTEWGRHPQQMQRIKQMQEQQRLHAEQHQTPILSHDQPASTVNNHFATSERPLLNKSELDPVAGPSADAAIAKALQK
jgi:hypothetical protein